MNYAPVISDMSRDIIYQKQCITEQWQLLKQENVADRGSCPKTPDSCNTNDSGLTVNHIMAEILIFLRKYKIASTREYALIHSKAAQSATVGEAVKSNTYDGKKKLFDASRALR